METLHSLKCVLHLLLLLAVFILFCAFRGLYNALRSGIWLLTGTYRWRHQAKLAENYNRSAQVLDIWLRYHNIDRYATVWGLQNFCLTHSRFENPNVVLRDNVMLLTFSRTEAIFLEYEQGFDPAKLHASSFIWKAMYEHAHRVITMPISSFHRLAESVGKPKGKLAFLSSTGRCGSTLVVQFFDETGKFRSFSEHVVFNYLSCLQKTKALTDAQFTKLLVNTVYLLCKPYLGGILRATCSRTTQVELCTWFLPW